MGCLLGLGAVHAMVWAPRQTQSTLTPLLFYMNLHKGEAVHCGNFRVFAMQLIHRPDDIFISAWRPVYHAPCGFSDFFLMRECHEGVQDVPVGGRRAIQGIAQDGECMRSVFSHGMPFYGMNPPPMADGGAIMLAWSA